MVLVIFVKYACNCQKVVALRIESFSCNHSSDAVLTGYNSTRQSIQVKFKTKIVKLRYKSYLNASKTKKTRKSTVLTKSYCLYFIKHCQICYGFMKTTLFWTLHFSAFIKTADTFNKNKRCYMTLEGLSNVCAKLEPASSENNEILAINVLQKFTSHVTCETLHYWQGFPGNFSSWRINCC